MPEHFDWVHERGLDADGDIFNDWLLITPDGRICARVEIPKQGAAYICHILAGPWEKEYWFYGEENAKLGSEKLVRKEIQERELVDIEIAEKRAHKKRKRAREARLGQ